jgi:glutamate 5-kinase
MEKRASILDPTRMKRVVIKLGSATLLHRRRGLREEVIGGLAEEIASLSEAHGISFVIVSSGAIAAGRKVLGLTGNLSLPKKQASASVGQTQLMEAYERAFQRRHRPVAQLLLTHEDFNESKRYMNVKQTLGQLFSLGVVPIINENDCVSTEEIRFGDNDHLAALVSHLIDADLMVLLTEHDGLYSGDPDADDAAVRIRCLERIDDELIDSIRAGMSGSSGRSREGVDRLGTGGMASKLLAARHVASWGCPVIITSGRAEQPLTDIFSGADVGTLVLPAAKARARGRKMWIAEAKAPVGSVTVDAGARSALVDKSTNLLAAGIIAVQGAFDADEVIHICDETGKPFAKGITGWSAEEIALGMGLKQAEIIKTLGEEMSPEVVQRDDLTLLPQDFPEESTRAD